MKNYIVNSFVFLQLLFIGLNVQAQGVVEKQFKNAEGPAPYILWQWINGCVTKEGITSDLESFKKAGITNVQQFLVGGIEADVTDSTVTVLGDKWIDLMQFSLEECKRLGMDFGTHNCPGWSASGAPGLKVESSMQKLIWSTTKVTGKTSKGTLISRAKVNSKYNYYQDICLVAVPAYQKFINKEEVIVILDGVDKENKLKSSLPKGEWEVIRFAHTTTAKINGTAPLSGQGLEVNKMSREALDEFWALYPAKLIELAGEHVGKTFKRLEIDSYEAGNQDWTPKMTKEFKNRRGYQLYNWLPVIAGYKIKSEETTNRFKDDWQKTINELFADNYYKYLEELIHKTSGLEFLCEPYGTGHKNFDETQIRGIGDVVMAEFWTNPTKWGRETLLPVSSNAHVNGKKNVAAEAFTGQPQYAFQTDLNDLKITGDQAFCEGINLFVLHASAHQPWPWLKPGMTMGWWGTQFGPSQTWWEHGASEWIEYVKRCQQILQKGLFVGDLCYLQLYRGNKANIPTGYKGDLCNEKELINLFSVKNNQLVLPDGMTYKVLVLPNNCRVDLPLAQKIEKLVNDGAIVIGNEFIGSPGLENYPEANDKVIAISKRLFGLNTAKKGVNNIGKGKVYLNYAPQEVLELQKIEKDVVVLNNKNNIGWIHRNDGNENYYFISNQLDKEQLAQITFRVDGMQPEIWNPVTGEIKDAEVWKNTNGKTIVDLNMDASESCFVVFRDKTEKISGFIKNISQNDNPLMINEHLVQHNGKCKLKLANKGLYKLTLSDNSVHQINKEKNTETILVNKNWNLSFPKNLGAPESAHFDNLMSWTNHENYGIKHFSGTAHYENKFNVENHLVDKNKQIVLDLGEVKNIAEVTINNKKVVVLWKPPYKIDISGYCVSGKNTIEVEVTNLWPNRMIGDKTEPEDCEWGEMRDFPYVNPVPVIGRNLQVVPDWVKNKTERPSKNRITFCTVDFFTKDTSLLPSGLLGPVKITVDELIDIKYLK